MKRIGIVLWAVLFLLPGGISWAGEKRVLVIHSYHPELAWVVQCNRGIDEVLGDGYRVEYVYLDTKRIPREAFAAKAEEARAAFSDFKPDLVMFGDDNALRMLGPEIADTGVPVIYFGINSNPRRYFDPLPDNVIGVVERIPVTLWARVLGTIVPGTRNILVLMDDSPTAEAIVEANFSCGEHVFVDSIRVECRMISRWEDWQRIIIDPGDYDLIILPVYHTLRKNHGGYVSDEAAILWSSEHTSIPLFAVQDYAVGDDGVVGAYTVVGEEHGRIAADMARAILQGGAMHKLMAPPDQKGRFYFNQKQLKRFGLTLPRQIRQQAVYQ